MKIKRIQVFSLLCFFLLYAAGCAQKEDRRESDMAQGMETVANLFAQTEAAQTKSVQEDTNDEDAADGETESQDIYARQGFVGLSFENLLEDENGYMIYEGGEARIDYLIQASDTADIGMGLILFVDGIPQPYYTEEESDYAYMHRFYPEDGEEIHTTFHFVPVTGQAGDELEVKAASIWYPDFAPDMVNTFYFGNYHSIMDIKSHRMRFEASPDQAETAAWPETGERLTEVAVKQEELTVEAREYALSRYRWAVEDLETDVLTMFYIDGIDMYSTESFDINGKDKLHLRVELMGCPLTECGITFYLDHVPLSCEGEYSFETCQTQGMVNVVEADIDISDLEGIHVLYALMTPKNEIDMTAAGNHIRLMHTRSVALYDREKLAE